MSRRHSEEVILHEMSSYFSEEEWKLLHEWQKELYRNVMKEIHQALISLGPLIATTVCSLRAKEKEELCSMENQGSERNHRIDRSTSDAISNTDVLLFKMHGEENVCLNNPQETEERQVNDCLSAGEEEGFPFINTDICVRKEEKPASIFISHLGEEVGESSTGSKSEHEVISFCIKDEDETYCMVHQGKKRLGSINSPTGDGIMSRKSKVGDSENITGKTTPYNLSSGKDKVRVLHSPENDAQCTSQPWSDNTEELGGDETSQSESAFGNNTAYFSVYKETPKVQSSNKYNDWESNLSHANVVTCQPDLPQNWRLYSCIECEKSFHKKENLMKHKRIHMGVRPYQCTECGRSFIRKENLIVHKRTHTGERPYHCTTCDKSFSQKGVLSRHQRTHIGERPYYCTECEKSFSLKGNLIAHQKTHTQHRLSP